jgi:hypothetical protein
LTTFQNVLQPKPPAYRIILTAPTQTYLVATSENLIGIENSWKWICEFLINDLEALDDINDQVDFALSKLYSLVHSQDQNSDEKSTDPKFRQAARSWRQIFRINESERLVNCKLVFKNLVYSCCYAKTISNQGWMYLSLRAIFFYSFVLRTETKVMIEYKDIKSLERESSKSVFQDSIRIVTKNDSEVSANV